MTQLDPTDIRLRPDGSIDTAYYMQRGREMRSQAAHDMFKRAPQPTTPPRSGPITALLRLMLGRSNAIAAK